MQELFLDGTSLTVVALTASARGRAEVVLCPNALHHMAQTRKLVDKAIADGTPVYGLTTGLGARAREPLDANTLADFSIQTLRGRAHAIGEPDSTENIRAAMIVRVNTLLTGYSGARPDVAKHICACLNAELTPIVGQIGSIGAADLILNATLGLSLIGEGEMRTSTGDVGTSADIMRNHGIEPLVLAPRDGLALANNTSAVAGSAVLALSSATTAFYAAQTAAAMSIEAFRANLSPLNKQILAMKPLPGQMLAANDLCLRLAGSQLFERGYARRLQDPLSFRNITQIHGTVSAAIKAANDTVFVEINSASDNPVAFLETEEIISSGAYFTSELTNVIEGVSRAFVHMTMAQLARISKHLNPVFSDLPTFLVQPNSGANGFAPLMKPAEALVSELVHQAQPVPIWPSINANGVEDCLASSPTAVKALARVASCSAKLTAIEFLVATQAVDLRGVREALGPYLSQVHGQIRHLSPLITKDRPLTKDVNQLSELIDKQQLLKVELYETIN